MDYNARMFSPRLGRFISADTIVPLASQGIQAWDRYSYVNNNPIVGADPSGHCLWDFCVIEVLTFLGVSAGSAALFAANAPQITAGALLAVDAVSTLTDVDSAIAAGNQGALAQAALSIPLAFDGMVDGDDLAIRWTEYADDVVRYNENAVAGYNRTYGGTTQPVLTTDTLVCRAGTCLAQQFEMGTGVIRNADGTLSNISVSSAPGTSLAELSKPFPNNQVGVSTVGEIRANGGNVVPSPSSGNPYHADLSGITAQQAERLFRPTVLNPNRNRSR